MGDREKEPRTKFVCLARSVRGWVVENHYSADRSCPADCEFADKWCACAGREADVAMINRICQRYARINILATVCVCVLICAATGRAENKNFDYPNNGVIQDGDVYDNVYIQSCSVDMYGGTVNGLVSVQGEYDHESEEHIYGVFRQHEGTVDTVVVYEDAVAHIYDGVIGDYLNCPWGEAYIYGYDFHYDPNGGSYNDGLITGRHDDGFPFSITLYDYESAYSTYERITLLPEPATIVLLLIGGLALLRRRRGVKACPPDQSGPG